MATRELVIRIALPRWSWRGWAAAVAVVGSLAAVVVHAMPMWPYVPPTYNKMDLLSSTALTAQFKQIGDNLNDLKAQVTALQVPLDCPPGYSNENVANITACKNASGDEVVKVGTGLSAFWIDRYEASVWSDAAGTQGAAVNGVQVPWGATDSNGNLVQDYPVTFPKNGQWTLGNQLYALSKAGVSPSASITWFQAQQACRASGKRLPTDEEWLAAAVGTQDRDGPCQINAANTGPWKTGMGANCASTWGAQDMIGNVYELTSQWFAGVGSQTEIPWPDPAYNGDGVWNVLNGNNGNSAEDGLKSWSPGIPASAIRGGGWNTGAAAGVFALMLYNAPTSWYKEYGFRCAVR